MCCSVCCSVCGSVVHCVSLPIEDQGWKAHMVSREAELLLAPGGVAAAGVSHLLLQGLLQAVHLPLPPLRQCFVEVPATQHFSQQPMGTLDTQDTRQILYGKSQAIMQCLDLAGRFLGGVQRHWQTAPGLLDVYHVVVMSQTALLSSSYMGSPRS